VTGKVVRFEIASELQSFVAELQLRAPRFCAYRFAFGVVVRELTAETVVELIMQIAPMGVMIRELIVEKELLNAGAPLST
jgi:hypothetical protein